MYVEVGSADTVLVICCEHLTEFRILEQSLTSKEVNLLTAPDKVTYFIYLCTFMIMSCLGWQHANTNTQNKR